MYMWPIDGRNIKISAVSSCVVSNEDAAGNE